MACYAASTEEEAPSAIRVLVRVRPLNDRESKSKSVLQLQSGETTAIDFGIKDAASSGDDSSSSVSAEGIVSIIDQQGTFTYDAVFGPESQQKDIFESVKGLVDAVVCGYNGTIVAYGQTSSGKTHTIFGEESSSTSTNEETAGLVQRSLKAIFDKMSGSEDWSGNSSSQHSAKASFFEIYNEKVYDLLSSNDNMLQESLAVREDSSKGVYVEGLMEHEVTNTTDAMDVLRVGNHNRRVAATSMNRVSSRSHAVFVLTVKNVITNDFDGTSKVLESKFTLVDLAGSERQKTTDAAGERLKEASMINNSLLCLGQVINSLVDKEQGKERHVPFRDSKLTFLLRDSWGGNSKTCLVATVTPSATSISETISTLKFAQRAKLIKNTAIKNETYSVAALQMEIARLKNELEQRNSNAISGVAASSGASGSSSIDRITISSLRNHNATLNEQVKVLKDQSNLMEQQLMSLNRKLQQETMIRKCKERRIIFLSSKSKDNGAENEEIAILQNEVNTLREQLESKQNPESIKWMMKYKEEKVKLEQIQNSNAAALYEANDKAELEAHLDSLLNAKDSLEQQLASFMHGRHSEMGLVAEDVAKLEKEVVSLRSQLSKKEAEMLHYEEEINATKSQINSLDKDRIEALEFLETVNSELVAEQKKVVELQASVDSMSQLIQEKENKAKEYQLKEAAQENELNDAMALLQTLQKNLDAANEANCSLIKNLNDATNALSAKETEVALLKSENKEALASFHLKQKEESDKLQSLQAQFRDKEEQMTSLLHQKAELEESIKNLTAQNAAVMAEVEALKNSRANWQARVDSLEDELVCNCQEKKQVEEELYSVREDLKRTIALQEECNTKMTEAHEIDLVQRDEAISLLRSEKENLQLKLDTAESGFKNQIEILQNEINATKKECESRKEKEENLLSTLDALTDGYDQLRLERDCIEKELKDTKKLLKKSTSMNAELERNSEAKLGEIEAAREECIVLQEKEKKLLSDLVTSTNTSFQLQSELGTLREELVTTKTLLENSATTNAELENSNRSKAVELDTINGEFEAAKEMEQQLLSELDTVKSRLSQIQLEKEAVEKDLAVTKTLLDDSASTNEELERSTAVKASEMEASMEELKDQVLRLSEENEAAKIFKMQVSELRKDNQSLQATIEKLQSSLSDSESAKVELDERTAAKVNEMKAVLENIKDEHAAEILELVRVAESVKAEMLDKEKRAVAKLKEMEDLVGSIKEQHAEEIERLNIDVEALKTMASEKEEYSSAKLKEAEELVENLKGHAFEIARFQKKAEVAEIEAISKQKAAEKKLSEAEMAVASLKDQYAAEIEELKQEAEIAKTEMMEKEKDSCAKLKEMEVAVTRLNDQHAKEVERLQREAEALMSNASYKEETSAASLRELEAAADRLKDEHAAEIERLNQEAEKARAEMMDKEEISHVKLKEMEEMIRNMRVQHAEEIEKMNQEAETLKASALDKIETTDAKVEREEKEGDSNDATFDEDEDFDESMFLPNVDVQPDASEIETDPPASPVADFSLQSIAPASTVADSAKAPPAVVQKVDENSPLSPSMTPFKARREIFANQPKQNTADENPSPKKPPTRRSRRNTATKTEEQTPVQMVTRRSTRNSSSRAPFTDLQDTSSYSTKKVRTNFQGGAFD
ncbi:hypothetical protein ACHAXM_002725 [Skeletonema potamos]